MENQTAQILENALQPPPPARALIAEKPVESRDAGEDFTMSAEWREEIRRYGMKPIRFHREGFSELLESVRVIGGKAEESRKAFPGSDPRHNVSDSSPSRRLQENREPYPVLRSSAIPI